MCWSGCRCFLLLFDLVVSTFDQYIAWLEFGRAVLDGRTDVKYQKLGIRQFVPEIGHVVKLLICS